LKKSSEFFYEKKKRVLPMDFFVEHLLFLSFFAFWKTKEVFSKNFVQKKCAKKPTPKEDSGQSPFSEESSATKTHGPFF
jgi:hypothetical protein